jgi:hypothetical protein
MKRFMPASVLRLIATLVLHRAPMLSWMAVHSLFRCHCAHQDRQDSASCFLLTVTFLMHTGRVHVTPGGPRPEC